MRMLSEPEIRDVVLAYSSYEGLVEVARLVEMSSALMSYQKKTEPKNFFKASRRNLATAAGHVRLKEVQRQRRAAVGTHEFE